MNFRETKTYTCMINLGFLSLIYWLLVVSSFFISYAFAFIYKDWGAVGWIVPLGVALFVMFLHSVGIAFTVLIYYKEFIKKETDISLGIIDKMNRRFNFNHILYLLSLISFLVTTFLLLVSPSLAHCLIFVLICFAYDFVVAKTIKKGGI